ncbi:MAG: Crp/Fnr family transcriptional regulator [Rhodospirillales bacterium]|nr:Crp/Fnr family transcriptional regulator [Rhodospirillales bacterium]
MPAKPPEPAKLQEKFDIKLFFSSVGVGRRIVNYQAMDPVFRQGDPADIVYYIEQGGVQITVVSDQGKEGIIATLGAGDFFGEGSLAGQLLYLASAHATKPTTVVAVDKAAMNRVLKEQPEMSEMFMTFLLTRNIQIEADLVDQLFNSSEKRLARVLLLLANFGKEGKLEAVVPKVSQEALAARVGTTRSRVNFFMNKFRKLGLVEYDGGELKVHSALLNIIIHD